MKILSLILSLFFTLVLPAVNPLFAQKGEVIVDFSSTQKPDTSYIGSKDTIAQPTQKVYVNPAPPANYAGIDSLKREMLALRKEMRNQEITISDMQMNLQKSHSKYKTGMFMFLGGFVLLNIVSNSINSTTPITQSQAYLILGSFGVTVAGLVIMIDSHKFIGRAGRPSDRYGSRRSYYY
jgi:hypothetical protein